MLYVLWRCYREYPRFIITHDNAQIMLVLMIETGGEVPHVPPHNNYTNGVIYMLYNGLGKHTLIIEREAGTTFEIFKDRLKDFGINMQNFLKFNTGAIFIGSLGLIIWFGLRK